MTFSTVKLAGQRTLVKGEDAHGTNGQVVLSSHQWDYIKAESTQDERIAAFDDAVEAFFKPLTDAAEKLEAEAVKAVDPIDVVTIGDSVDHVEGRPAREIVLSHDSKVLRLIEEGQQDRLIWVNGNLEITEYVPEDPTDVVGDAAASYVRARMGDATS